MKYIQINTNVNLQSGITLPSGSVVVIAEGYVDIKSTKDGFIPSQIATLVYASLDALQSGKVNINEVEDFNPVFSGLQLSIQDYETKTAQDLLVATIYNELSKVYGTENVVIVD
jgi:hypothetical protein